MTTTAPLPEQGTARRKRSRWLILLVAFLLVGSGAAVAAVVVSGDKDPASAAQLPQVQAACGDWMTSPQGGDQGDSQWCTDMFTWMSDQSGGSMMGSMMWQGADQLGTACRAWVGQDHAEMGTSGPQRCNDMIAWMDDHMSSRDGNWMMHNG